MSLLSLRRAETSCSMATVGNTFVHQAGVPLPTQHAKAYRMV